MLFTCVSRKNAHLAPPNETLTTIFRLIATKILVISSRNYKTCYDILFDIIITTVYDIKLAITFNTIFDSTFSLML